MNGFDEIMTSASPHVRDLAMRTRNLIREVLPDVVEVPWVQQRTIGYGVGPKKNSEHFCFLDVHTNHVNLGFNYGAELPDPEQVLEGSGKRFRHVKIKAPEDLANPALRRLLEVASTHRMPPRPSS